MTRQQNELETCSNLLKLASWPVARGPNAAHVNIWYGLHQNLRYPSQSATSCQNEAPW